eukprot:403348613
MFKLYKYPNGTHYRKWTYQEIPYSRCTRQSEALKMLDKSDLEEYPIHFFYCPDFNNFTLQGIFHSPEYQYLYLEFKKCSNLSLCPNSTVLKKRIETSSIQIIALTAFFEVESYEKPVNYFMDDAFYPLIDQQNINGVVNIRSNELELHDSTFGFWDDEEKQQFYSISTYTTFPQSLTATDGSLFSLQVQLDKYVDRFSRQVYTVNDMLEELGGISAVLFFIGFIIYSNFQESKFFFSMARNLFLIQDSTQIIDSDEDDDSDLFGIKSEKEGPSSSKEIKMFNEQKKRKQSITKKQKLKDNLKNLLLQQTSGDSEKILQRIYEYVKIRGNLNFYYKDIFCSVFENFGFCCRKKKQSQHQLSNAKRKILLNKGKDRFIKEMDCVNIVKKLRMVENLAELLLNIPQQILLYNQKKDVIHVDSSSDDDNIAPDLKNVRNRIQSNIKLFSAFDYYKSKREFSEIDKRIIMGTVSNNPSFFNKDELEKNISHKIKQFSKLSVSRNDLIKVEDLNETLNKSKIQSKKKTIHNNISSLIKSQTKNKSNSFIDRNIGLNEHEKNQMTQFQNCFDINQESSRKLVPQLQLSTRRAFSDVFQQNELPTDQNQSPKDQTNLQEFQKSHMKNQTKQSQGTLSKLKNKSLIISSSLKQTGSTDNLNLLGKDQSQESIKEGEKLMEIKNSIKTKPSTNSKMIRPLQM